MIAHLYYDKGELAFSGYNASGDPAHKPWAAVIDVGRDFMIFSGDEPHPRLCYKRHIDDRKYTEFTAEGLLIASRAGWFGFKLIEEAETASKEADKKEQVRKKIDRRRRPPREQPAT